MPESPPPSSGGVVVCEILNVLEGYPLKDLGFRAAQAVHYQIEAMRHEVEGLEGEALDEALCFGWIDGLKRSYDEVSYLQKFTPRRKKSLWSKQNREHIARLIETKRMMPAGLAEVEQAQHNCNGCQRVELRLFLLLCPRHYRTLFARLSQWRLP